MHCTKLGWIGVYTFAKFASALVNFSYKFVHGNKTFNDRPLTDLKNQVRAIIMNAHPVVRGKRADACATVLFLHGGGV